VSDDTNKLILVIDLVDKLEGNLVEQLVHKKDLTCVFDVMPDVCPHCHSDEMHGIEIMGAKKGVLLWECCDCLDVYLKYDKNKTEKELQSASGYWTNIKDWGKIPRAEFN
tara:strand:- start:114 stop:443 length:330 start_codon:yes stop_codon:yes gene_type:complete